MHLRRVISTRLSRRSVSMSVFVSLSASASVSVCFRVRVRLRHLVARVRLV